jgi:hypothetical protein
MEDGHWHVYRLLEAAELSSRPPDLLLLVLDYANFSKAKELAKRI